MRSSTLIPHTLSARREGRRGRKSLESPLEELPDRVRKKALPHLCRLPLPFHLPPAAMPPELGLSRPRRKTCVVCRLIKPLRIVHRNVFIAESDSFCCSVAGRGPTYVDRTAGATTVITVESYPSWTGKERRTDGRTDERTDERRVFAVRWHRFFQLPMFARWLNTIHPNTISIVASVRSSVRPTRSSHPSVLPVRLNRPS